MRHRKNRRGGRGPSRASFASFGQDPSFNSGENGPAGDDFFRRSADRRADQKARQLCRQVFRTLSLALPACDDDLLQDLTVLAVDPAPDGGRLLVTVSAGPAASTATESAAAVGDEPLAPDEAGAVPAVHVILDRLSRAAGMLRSEVAGAIVRKRAPELVFRVVSSGSSGEVQP